MKIKIKNHLRHSYQIRDVKILFRNNKKINLKKISITSTPNKIKRKNQIKKKKKGKEKLEAVNSEHQEKREKISKTVGNGWYRNQLHFHISGGEDEEIYKRSSLLTIHSYCFRNIHLPFQTCSQNLKYHPFSLTRYMGADEVVF